MEEKKNTQPKDNAAKGNNEEKSGAEGTEKTFTQEELNEILQSRLEREREKLSEEVDDKIKRAKEEAEKMAQMSAKEREEELRKQQEQELAKKEQELKLRENKLEAIDILSENGLPIKMVDLIIDTDRDAMKEKIERLTSSWKESVESSVEERLKGTAPKDVKTTGQNTKPPAIKTVL